MKPAALRLAVTAVLFAGWVGYLAYLAAMTRNPIVLSRPQFLVSEMDVIATRTGADTFAINDVLYPKTADSEKGKTVVVRNLGQCQMFTPKEGWRTTPPPEGQPYLIPLESAGPPVAPDQPALMNVVPIPPSPGYPPQGNAVGPPRIYPADEPVMRQYRLIPKP